jgi:hypothetical protein
MFVRAKIFFLLVFFSVIQQSFGESFVTYEPTWGRFGDHLVSYMHAKWLSYKNGLTFLYRPFIYSDGLQMDYLDKRLDLSARDRRVFIINSEKKLRENFVDGIIYSVPYFPESPYELKNHNGVFFTVDWEDQNFIRELKKTICSKKPLLTVILPKDKITVAMHVRRGGSFEPINEGFPVKFPKDAFYVQALHVLCKLLHEQDLYVFIFTDDRNPAAIAQSFSSEFKDKNIIFDYRRKINDYNLNVLEDFFSMTQFDCLIRADSNFSLCASKLKRYLVHISPGDCLGKGEIGIRQEGLLQYSFDF